MKSLVSCVEGRQPGSGGEWTGEREISKPQPRDGRRRSALGCVCGGGGVWDCGLWPQNWARSPSVGHLPHAMTGPMWEPKGRRRCHDVHKARVGREVVKLQRDEAGNAGPRPQSHRGALPKALLPPWGLFPAAPSPEEPAEAAPTRFTAALRPGSDPKSSPFFKKKQKNPPSGAQIAAQRMLGTPPAVASSYPPAASRPPSPTNAAGG